MNLLFIVQQLSYYCRDNSTGRLPGAVSVKRPCYYNRASKERQKDSAILSALSLMRSKAIVPAADVFHL